MHSGKIYETLENSKYLPLMPEPIGEILKLLHSPENLEIEELSKKVALCDDLSNLVLSAINSAYFQLNRTITSLNEAIIYLGMRTVQNLLISFTLQTLFSKKESTSKLFNRDKYLKHSLGTSLASSMISEKAGLCKKFELFTYGLVHDMGIAVLDACMPDVLDQVTEMQHRGFHQIAAERYVMDGVTHGEIGAWLCDKWGFPNDIKNVVEYHHKPLLAKGNINEVKIMNLGDIISTSYYEKLLGLKMDHTFSKMILESVGITHEDMEEVSSILPEEVNKINRLNIFKF